MWLFLAHIKFIYYNKNINKDVGVIMNNQSDYIYRAGDNSKILAEKHRILLERIKELSNVYVGIDRRRFGIKHSIMKWE